MSKRGLTQKTVNEHSIVLERPMVTRHYHMEWDLDKCIGCKTCVTVCPFGGISFNKVTQEIMKCDFCDGDPACVKVCEPEAIRYADITDLSIGKRARIAEKVFSLYRNKGTGIDPDSDEA